MKRIRNFFIICFLLFLVFAAFIAIRYYPLRYIDIINEYSNEYGFDTSLICAVIYTESKFDKNAVSKKGAGGLMQIIESTAYWLADQIDIEDFDYSQIFQPEINIRLGCYYLNKLLIQYGDIETALCAYNAGSGNVSRWLNNPDNSDDGKTIKSIPYAETRNYIKRINDTQKIYSLLFKLVRV